MRFQRSVIVFFGIVIRNVLSPIFVLITLLSILLFLFGETTDALFLMSTISLNCLVAIVQETRARGALEKLEILTTQYARLITAHGISKVPISELLVGSHIEIQSGDQVPGDGIILHSSGCMVDEALLTGESLAVNKAEKEYVYAGSTVVSGKAEVRLTAVGESTHVHQVTKKLKWFDNRLTPIQQMITSLIRWLTIVTVLLSALIFLNALRTDSTVADIVRTIVAGAIPLVPEGLILASTLLFTYGAVKMMQVGVLVKRSAVIEGFGRLNILCVDKTGTLTESDPSVHAIIPLGGHSLNSLEVALSALVEGEPTPSTSLKAITQQIPRITVDIHDVVPFSSVRKWSAVSFTYENRIGAISMGAPEVLSVMKPFSETVTKNISSYTKQGLRVMVVLRHSGHRGTLHERVARGGEPIGLVILTSKLRPQVIDTIFYLQAHNVTLKVISGDSPETVQFIAKKVGIRDTNHLLTGDQLAEMSEEEWKERVPQTTIFARILPEQKERLVTIFSTKGYTGMVGDGVNDTLALKRADFGVAMFEGSEAARQVADVVLLNNSFSAFPIGMRLGSQIIIGLEMVSCLFFNRIIAGAVMLLISLAMATQYPFLPRHLILISFFIVGFPTLLWSLIPPESSVRLNPKDFFRRTLRFALPNGLVTGLAVSVIYSIITLQSGAESARTAAVIVTTCLGLLTFRLIPLALGAIDSQVLRTWQLFYLLITPAFLIIFATQEWFTTFFALTPLTLSEVSAIVLVTLLAAWVQLLAADGLRNRFRGIQYGLKRYQKWLLPTPMKS